jgi:hypothetical protein
MATLTNDYKNCELLNLGYGPNGRGPFAVRQDGSPPGSLTFEEDRFLLRKDGTWVLNLLVFAFPEKEKEQFLYDNSAEAMSVLNALAGPPIVQAGLPEGRSKEEIKAAAKSGITGLWAKIRDAKSASGSAS